MKAVVYTQYGPPEVLRLQNVDMPSPKSSEVLIRIHATTVNRTDCGFRSAKYVISRIITGLIKPKFLISGSEFAGEIVTVGEDVTTYKVGDRVIGFDDVRAGAHAEYVAKDENSSFSKISKKLPYEALAPAGEGATYALNVIHASGIMEGQKAMVYGASGAIGSAAVQILKQMGVKVTAVCGVKGFDQVFSLGANKTINYDEEDFTAVDERYDLVFDAVGKSSYGVCKTILTPRGTYYSSELGKMGQNPLLAIWFKLQGSKRVIFPIPKIDKENMTQIATLIENDDFRPLIDRVYSIDDIVDAAKYVETGQKIGNVVITLAS